jgi:DNA-binding response OmpR family regulator
MTQSCILVVEADLLVRNPLAEYLRECGYRVIEACSPAEARQFLDKGSKHIDIVLADVDAPGESGFALAAWIRSNHPDVEVILAGTVVKVVEKAGDLCAEGPAISKPYEHQFVLHHIRRLQAARQRSQ